MHKKVKEQMIRAKKMGISPIELAAMRESARKAAEAEVAKMRGETLEQAFLLMVAIPLNVLYADYWQKTAKNKAKKYITEVFKLYEAFTDGIVTDEELDAFVTQMTGKCLADFWKEFKETNGQENNN